MPKLKNSNAAFWVIFKHCVHLLFRVTLLLQPSWLYCWPKQVFFFDLGKQKKKQLCVNAESEIENNSAWEKVIGSVVVRHLNFGWTTQRVCVIYISEGIVEFFVKKCGNILRDAGQPHAKFCPIYFCQNWAPFRSIFWSSRSNEKGKEVNYYYTTTYLRLWHANFYLH